MPSWVARGRARLGGGRLPVGGDHPGGSRPASDLTRQVTGPFTPPQMCGNAGWNPPGLLQNHGWEILAGHTLGFLQNHGEEILPDPPWDISELRLGYSCWTPPLGFFRITVGTRIIPAPPATPQGRIKHGGNSKNPCDNSVFCRK